MGIFRSRWTEGGRERERGDVVSRGEGNGRANARQNDIKEREKSPFGIVFIYLLFKARVSVLIFLLDFVL